MNANILDHFRAFKKASLSKDEKPVFEMEKTLPFNALQCELTPVNQKINGQFSAPRLSAKTRMLINKIRKSGDNCLESGETSETALPSKFEWLLRLLEATDSLLNVFRVRGAPAHFEELKTLLFRTLGETATVSDFQKIAGLSPKFYRFEWLGNSLTIDFPETAELRGQPLRRIDLECRRKYLEKRLKKAFKSFKRETAPNDKQLNEKGSEGHSDSPKLCFEVTTSTAVTQLSDSNPNIGPTAFLWLKRAELPPRNGELVGEELSAFVHRATSAPLEPNPQPNPSPRKGVLEQLRANGLINDLIRPSPRELNNRQKTELLREKLTVKIREREAQRKKTEIYYESLAKSIDIEEAQRVAELIKFYFTSRRVSNAFFVKVVEFVSKNFGKAKSFDEANFAVNSTIGLLPQWLRVVPNRAGDIIKIDAAMEIKAVSAELARSHAERIRESQFRSSASYYL